MSRETSEASESLRYVSAATMNPTEPQFARGSVLKATQERVKRQHAIIIALREENERLREALLDTIRICFDEETLREYREQRRGSNETQESDGGHQPAGTETVPGA